MTPMTERQQFAEQNEMSLDFVNWFFDEKKESFGNMWFLMAAALWEGWKGRDNREAQPELSKFYEKAWKDGYEVGVATAPPAPAVAEAVIPGGLVYSSALPEFESNDSDKVIGYHCFISGQTRSVESQEQAYADAKTVINAFRATVLQNCASDEPSIDAGLTANAKTAPALTNLLARVTRCRKAGYPATNGCRKMAMLSWYSRRAGLFSVLK